MKIRVRRAIQQPNQGGCHEAKLHRSEWVDTVWAFGLVQMIGRNWARVMSGCLLGWCLGVALQLQQVALWPMPVYGACLAVACGAAVLAGADRMSGAMRGLLGCGLCACLAFAVTGLHAHGQAERIAPTLEGQDLEVVGVVQAMPQRQDVGWRFRFQIEQAWRLQPDDGLKPLALSRDVPKQVYLGWYGQEGQHDSGWSRSALPEPVQAGERWRFRVRLKAPHGHMNPRVFDYELWLWEQGIGATGAVRTRAQDPPPVRLGSTGSHPIEAWRQTVRERLLARLTEPGADAEALRRAGVLAALVVGDQAAIDRSDWDVFRATGVAHLMSISGLHVTMFAWLASACVGWLWRRSALWGFAGPLQWPAVHVGAVSGLLLAGFYALFSGWGLPAQRTLLMLGVVVVLRLSARQWPGPLVWLTACAVVLAWDPWALLQPGFWLSFVAAGVLMASDPAGVQRRALAPEADTRDAPTWRTGQGFALNGHRFGAMGAALGQQLFSLLREQLTIGVALAPLSLLFFGQLSLVGLLANLLAIPWVTLVITPLAMLGVVVPVFWDGASWVLWPLVVGLGWLSDWPLASVSTAMPPWGLAVLALGGALALVLRMPLSWKLMCVPLLWPAVFWTPARPAHGHFEWLAADVGQGNAVLIRTARHSLLYDAGPRYSAESDAGHRVLVPWLAQMGERLDVLMLSHRDSDHTGGAAAVLAMQKQAELWSSLEDEHPLHALRPAWTRCQAGQSWVWDGVHFEVLHPLAPGGPDGQAGEMPGTRSASQVRVGVTSRATKPNHVSCVLRISGSGVSALLTGDIEIAQEALLVEKGLAPVDVMLSPHHGSKTSSSLPFLTALSPRFAFVQAGYRNRFGHPAAEVVVRYQSQGIHLVESTRCGAATWRSHELLQVQCERQARRRYWHHEVPP